MRTRRVVRSIFGLTARERANQQAAAPAAPDTGWSTSKRPRRTHVGFRIAAWAGVILLLVAGINQVVIRPLVNAFASPPAAATPEPELDVDAARAVAAAYTADYLSYDSTRPGDRAAAVARWTGEGGGAGVANWTGDGQLHTDLVTPGAVALVDDDHALVAVTARVTPATLTEGATAPETTAVAGTATAPAAADPGPATAPWVAQPARWLTLHVPVVLTDGRLQVAARGAVFGSGQLTAIPRPDNSTDNALTSSTANLPADVFTAVAEGRTDYITTPGATLPDLAGALTVADTSTWSVSGGTTTRYATTAIEWQLTGTTLQLVQTYALQLTDDDGRWLVAAIDAPTEETR